MSAPRCPYCEGLTARPGAAPACPHCGRALTPTVQPASGARDDWNRLFANADAVYEELQRVREVMHDVSETPPAEPLPSETPAAADALGPPITSVDFVPPRQRRQRTGGLVVFTLGVLLLALALGLLTLNDVSYLMIGYMVALGLLIVSVGGWVAFIRAPARRTVWICDEGVVWSEGRLVRQRRWDDLEGLYLGRETDRIWVRLLFGTSELYGSWPSVAPEARSLELLEARAAAALLPTALRRAARGRAEDFGALTLSRAGLTYRGSFHPWGTVVAVHGTGEALRIDHRGGRLVVPAGQVAFTAAALAVARVLHAQSSPTL